MWTIKWYGDAKSRLKSFQKKYRHETINVVDNLETLLNALCGGTKPEQLKKLGFVHSEPEGILAIDQRGPGKGAKMKALRLYVYPNEPTEILHVMRFGDKSKRGQSNDIRLCQDIVKDLTGGSSDGKSKTD